MPDQERSTPLHDALHFISGIFLTLAFIPLVLGIPAVIVAGIYGMISTGRISFIITFVGLIIGYTNGTIYLLGMIWVFLRYFYTGTLEFFKPMARWRVVLNYVAGFLFAVGLIGEKINGIW